jgi:hypothetical protein
MDSIRIIKMSLSSRLRGKGRSGATPKYVRVMMDDPCIFCGGTGGTIEHIYPRSLYPKVVPLPETGFSRDHWTNLANSCQSCNMKRGAKGLLFYLVERYDEAMANRQNSDFSQMDLVSLADAFEDMGIYERRVR